MKIREKVRSLLTNSLLFVPDCPIKRLSTIATKDTTIIVILGYTYIQYTHIEWYTQNGAVCSRCNCFKAASWLYCHSSAVVVFVVTRRTFSVRRPYLILL